MKAFYPARISLALACLVAFVTCLLVVRAQQGPVSQRNNDPEKAAYVSFVNACTTDLKERWRASVDIAFKGAVLATDLRVGENSLLRPVETDGQGTLEVRRHGSSEVLERIPASLQPGSFSTVVLSGVIGSKSDVQALVLRDYPLAENQSRPGLARFVLLTTITGYPTRSSIGGHGVGNLRPGSAQEVFVEPGEKEIQMFFKDKKFGDRELHTVSGAVAVAGGNVNVIFFDSPRMPGRPNVLVIDTDLQRKELLEGLSVRQESR